MRIEYGDFELTLYGSKGRERLGISSVYPRNEVSELLFSNLGLMHLIGAYLPAKVETNFPIARPFAKLMGAMYRSEGKQPPCFSQGLSNKKVLVKLTKRGRALVTYSAGKDSMWNMWWAQNKFGPENVAALHISGLNRNNASQERNFAIKQALNFDFKNFRILGLLNSSRNTGYKTMRSRDIFLAGMAIPIAIEFGAQKVITEGFAETGPKEPFSGQPENIEYFNSTLQMLGISVQVAWRDRLEMDTVMDLFENKPEWMPHVCNCFASPCYLPSRRVYWQRNATSIDLYNSQCGSCVKCRIVILGRILYDPKFTARTNDIVFFLENTDRWLRSNKVKLRDMVAGSFRRDFIMACSKYGVIPKSLTF